MLGRFRIPLAAGALAVPAAFVLAAGPAVAAAPTDVTNTETVQARLDATGAVTEARVYEQIAITGDGEVEVVNPVSTAGLRNLDGFGGFSVDGDTMTATVDVQGRKRLRTVSDYEKDLPLQVEVTYLLNGEKVDPEDVVGATGELEVGYKVTNRTATKQTVTYDDGTGKQISEDLDVVIPMVGSLSTTLPATFTDVTSEQANVAGDGRGGTKLSFTMTLFPPIGSPTAEFGYTAKIRDGEVPPASISALPVQPLKSPSFKGGAESYKGGAETGAELTDGATQIDENLLKLRDGAGELLAGLIQLREGADQLKAGLQDEAAPGAQQLADGAEQAADGADELAGGLRQLAAGNQRLSDGFRSSSGAADLVTGSQQLSDGINRLIAGLRTMPDTVSKDDGYLQLQGALEGIRDGIGSQEDGIVPDPQTLNQGINGLQFGLSNKGCNKDQPEATRCGVQQVLETLSYELSHGSAASVPAPTALAAATDALDQALKGDGGTDGTNDGVGAAQAIEYLMSSAVLNCDQPSPLDPSKRACLKVRRALELPGTPAGNVTVEPEVTHQILSEIRQQIGARTESGTALYALYKLVYAIDPAQPQIAGHPAPGAVANGLEGIRGGLTNPDCDLEDPQNEDNPCGIKEISTLISGGVDRLVSAISNTLVTQVMPAAFGSSTLANKVAEAGDGARELAAGSSKASAGANRLADGNGKIADGADELADGLGDAADGSGKLADGLGQAADGAPQLVDGAQRLSDEGTSLLVDAGMETAADYGQKYALIEAGAERAESEGMAFGAPEGARGMTAYSLELAGVDGEGSRNVGRGLAALAVFGLGSGLVTVVRGRLV